MFWSNRYADFEGSQGALEFFGQVRTQKSRERGYCSMLEYFGQLVWYNLREKRVSLNIFVE
jgi:hypothetical protein